MGEQLSVQGWAGALMVTTSVVLVALQQPPETTRQRDRSGNIQLQGLVLALLAVICGVAGAALSRTVLLSTALTPMQSAACRLLGIRPSVRPTPLKVVLGEGGWSGGGSGFQNSIFSSSKPLISIISFSRSPKTYSFHLRLIKNLYFLFPNN